MTSTDRLNEFASPNQMLMARGVDGGTEHEDNFFSLGKVIFMGAMFLFTVLSIVTMVIYNRQTGLAFLIITTILSIFGYRFIVFEEKKYTRLFATCRYGEISNCGLLDGVVQLNATDKRGGCTMYMKTGEVGCAFEVSRGSIVGKGSDFYVKYYDVCSDVLQQLIKKGHTVIMRKVLVNCKEDTRLRELQKLPEKVPNKALSHLMADEIGHIMQISNEVKYEREYWFVYSEGASKEEELKDDVKRAVRLLQTVAPGTRVCDKADLIKLNREEIGCSGANLSLDRLKQSSTKPLIEDFAEHGLHLVGVGLTGYRVGVREEDNNRLQVAFAKNKQKSIYSGDYNAGVLETGTPKKQHLQVDNLEKLVFDTMEKELDRNTDITLKNVLFKEYIVNTAEYKNSLAEKFKNISWEDEDDE